MSAYFSNPQGSASKPIRAKADLVAIFEKYGDAADPEIILIDGTLLYLEALGFEPENLISLTLAYVLKSPQMGVFTKMSFYEVWSSLNIASEAEMSAYIRDYHRTLLSSSGFEAFYQYVFEFLRASDTRIKTIAYDDAVLYWQLLFTEVGYSSEILERLDQWYAYVNSVQKNISKDTWNMFYKYLVQVIATDPKELSGYDEMSAWPSMVDEFMEYLGEQ